jgi:uncharacterized protein
MLVAIPLVGMAIFFMWQWWNGGVTPKDAYEEVRQTVPGQKPSTGGTGAPAAEVGVSPTRVAEQSALPRVNRKSRKHRGDIVLIIDDLGFEGQPIDRLMKLDPNVNCAILPNGTDTEKIAAKLHEAGFELLCHMPMQPEGRESPGRNAILTSMSDEEIATATRENLAAVPNARGVNNHMGSRATSDRRVMSSVLGALPQGMYFVDSRTSGGSVAGTVAKEMRIPTASRQIFLDDVQSERAVRKQVEALADAAEKRGVAIGIGHPHAVTMRVLADELPDLKARGFRLVRASSVVR